MISQMRPYELGLKGDQGVWILLWTSATDFGHHEICWKGNTAEKKRLRELLEGIDDFLAQLT